MDIRTGTVPDSISPFCSWQPGRLSAEDSIPLQCGLSPRPGLNPPLRLRRDLRIHVHFTIPALSVLLKLKLKLMLISGTLPAFDEQSFVIHAQLAPHE